MNSPVATTITYAEMLKYDVPLVAKVKSAINYYRFKACISQSEKGKQPIPHIGIVWGLCKPLGWLMHRKDLRLLAAKSE